MESGIFDVPNWAQAMLVFLGNRNQQEVSGNVILALHIFSTQ